MTRRESLAVRVLADSGPYTLAGDTVPEGNER